MVQRYGEKGYPGPKGLPGPKIKQKGEKGGGKVESSKGNTWVVEGSEHKPQVGKGVRLSHGKRKTEVKDKRMS